MNRGFTLLELLIVITIIAILASILLVSVSGSRDKGINASIIATVEEYEKAIELVRSHTGVVPMPNTFNTVTPPNPPTRSRVICLGSGMNNECMGNVSHSTYPTNAGYRLTLEAALIPYLPQTPAMPIGASNGTYYAIAYSGCRIGAAATPYFGTVGQSCTDEDYSIWYLLKGINADCGAGVQVYSNWPDPPGTPTGLTMCRLSRK